MGGDMDAEGAGGEPYTPAADAATGSGGGDDRREVERVRP